MKLIIPDYAKNYNLLPFKTNEEALEQGLEFGSGLRNSDEDYVIYWGHKPYKSDYGKKYGIMETGFFHNASFIDTVGNYQHISLNTAEGYREVKEFELGERRSAQEIIFSMKPNNQSKYNATFNQVDIDTWTGPVLILQNPTDRSIMSVTSKNEYLNFIKEACAFYGDSLFVKFHPWNSGEKFTELEDIVKPYGCKYGKASMKIIEQAEFCLAFNSTFAVDAVLRGVPYIQYGMGTFFNAYGVQWSKETFPVNVKPINDAYKLADFLIHKFCFNKNMDGELFGEMVKHYSTSKEMFPMIDKYSYANNLPT